ncbi:cell wall-binding repeat-containing protein [Ornithinimicrobium pekingense]|uniref:SGNH domain-containing protein n=1 Tax=Ornithinimicrobium pekingense TaxID=384677 RepID=A0ABQ2FC95_9MICO|nr:cell wall-binding repeat-containing protein [Ornithinimicrobium pekingense]GGK71635.1 hypothetical protein GCM10011509_20230 [Ornithinimicrobium pekingense]
MRADLQRRPSGSRGRVGAWLALLLVAALALGASPATAVVGDENDLGARSLRGEGWSVPELGPGDLTRSGPVFPQIPPVDNLHRWHPAYYADGCHAPRRSTVVADGCLYGDTSSDVTVAMIGDSKVGQLFPALEEIALREGWVLRTYTKSSCSFVDRPTPGYEECDDYNAALRKHLRQDPPDMAFIGGMRRDVGDDYVRTWSWLRSIGVQRVVAFWDTPVPKPNPTECVVDALQDGTDLTGCAIEMPEAVSGTPSLRAAAEVLPFAEFIDLRDWVCPESELSPLCAPVVGRSHIYSDGSHLAQGYSATLTDPIHQRLHEAGVAAYRPSVDRVSGRDRYATAAELSRSVQPGGRVFVASGRDYPDALAAAATAGADGGAVLLTTPGSLPTATREALVRLAPAQVVVVGGPTKVEDGVLDQLAAYAARVDRVAGPDRYATAAQLARLGRVKVAGTVYVATGTGFPDALAAAAQAGQQDSPILLVQPGNVPDATAEVLGELAPTRIVVAGGPGSVSEEVLAELDTFAGEVERRGGTNRYETAALLARDTPPGRVLHVSVATDFADALAAAPLAAASGGAVLLVASEKVPSATGDAVRALRPDRVVLTGGPGVVATETRRELIRLVG